MYTTACEQCRKVRIRCVRPSRGQNEAETCDRCRQTGMQCTTVRRKLGRQLGVKNRPKVRSGSPTADDSYSRMHAHSEHLPNPLQVLAAEAVGDIDSDLTDQAGPSSFHSDLQSARTADKEHILGSYHKWCSKIHPDLGEGAVERRISSLLSGQGLPLQMEVQNLPVFCGRSDMSKPDACPENDIVSLQVITLVDAERLYRSFMDLITNGSMYFDPHLHTLSYVRSRSSYLLAVILAIASTYISLNLSRRLHDELFLHVQRLEMDVIRNNNKSVEIVQAYLLLASWSDVPTVLARDRTWTYISRAIGMAVELRLDCPLPHCIQSDPMYSMSTKDILVRNAHRVCYLLFIHDRNMAMVAGRYPVFPEAAIFSSTVLNRWGSHRAAYRFDEPICASVSLRRVISGTLEHLATHTPSTFLIGIEVINNAISAWRTKWTSPIQSTHEYDIIARFSAFVLALTLLKKGDQSKDDPQARAICEDMAFEVCCASIMHYKTWVGLLNSATFDTCMVAFCAIYIIQSINRPTSQPLSDWDLFRIATLQELVSDLEKQAEARHPPISQDSMTVVDAMAKQLQSGLRVILSRRSLPPTNESLVTDANNSVGVNMEDFFNPQSSDMAPFMFDANNAMPFIPEWDVGSLLPDLGSPWGTGDGHDLFLRLNQ